jgi:hypothetical protein
MNEGFADFTVNKSKPAGWRSATFMSNGEIPGGSYIWFGVFAEFFWETRFDYGAKCYASDWWNKGDSIPNTYPHYNINWFDDFKLSMYFTYTSLAQNHVRILTQGVGLSDNRKLKADFKRSLTQTAGVNSLLVRFPLFLRNITEAVKATTAKFENLFLSRKCADSVQVNSGMARIQNILRKAQDIVSGADTQSFSVLFFRNVADSAIASQQNYHWGSFIRGLAVTAGSTAETRHKAEYYRFNSDTVHASGAVFRGLLLFVKIISRIFIRDYLLGRFLKAREELILKSAITREIVLNSKID